MIAETIVAAVVVVLVLGGRVIGTLTAEDRRPRHRRTRLWRRVVIHARRPRGRQ